MTFRYVDQGGPTRGSQCVSRYSLADRAHNFIPIYSPSALSPRYVQVDILRSVDLGIQGVQAPFEIVGGYGIGRATV